MKAFEAATIGRYWTGILAVTLVPSVSDEGELKVTSAEIERATGCAWLA